MAATFYAEPTLTFDLDVFVLLQPSKSGLVSLSPIYEALRARGYGEERDCVLIEGVPVQFLPAYNALVEEELDFIINYDIKYRMGLSGGSGEEET